MHRRDRVLGMLWGTALGDALGLPFEGLPAQQVTARYRGDRFRLLGPRGFVSDDTEQSALLVQALVASRGDDDACLARFRASMVGWLLRRPFGIGGATLRSCLRMAFGLRRPGVRSAGNGAAMRAGVLGVCLAREPERRRRLGGALASLTHTDPRAVEGALYVAELAANCAVTDARDRNALVRDARTVVTHPELSRALDRGLALGPRPPAEAARDLGHSGFVVHTVGLCTHCFLHAGESPLEGIRAAIHAGGDTDTHAAIVGGWLGALHGASALPEGLVRRIDDGPFGPTHLARLADAACGGALPRWSWPGALLRNLALYPVVLAHGVGRLFIR